MIYLKPLQGLLDRPFPPMMVDDLLIQQTLVMLVGQPGTGKTFVALDLALSIAAGLPTWLDHPLRVSGPVVYGIGEGAGRFKLRILAWCQHHGIDPAILEGKFFWTDGPLNLLDTKAIKAFVAEAATINPVLVIVDTYSRSISGQNENDHEVTSKAVESMDLIRHGLASMVLALHHTNAAGKRERGNSSFLGAIDTQLWLTDDDGLLTLESGKQKDLDDFPPIELSLSTITVRGLEDAGGQAVSSAVLEVDADSGDNMMFNITNVLEHEADGKGCMSKAKLTKKVGKKKESVGAVIVEMVELGKLEVKGKGRGSVVCLVEVKDRER